MLKLRQVIGTRYNQKGNIELIVNRIRNPICIISISGDEILDSDWLTAVHYLSIMVPQMMIVCLSDEKSGKRQFSRHKRVFDAGGGHAVGTGHYAYYLVFGHLSLTPPPTCT